MTHAEVVGICSDLIRIDTTNTGDDSGAGERRAAEYVAAALAEVGLEPVIYESAPGRANVVARFEAAAADRGSEALLVHGHLDVVPADPGEWSVHPLSGEVTDGFVWGRGAIDMKDFDAMVLATVRRMRREGRTPRRDLVLTFLADEESGGEFGAQWMVESHRDVFDGCTEAVGEVGGFSITVGQDSRVYPIQTAEKGVAWLRLHATGRPGHGSMLHDDNAVTALAEAVARLGRHRFPVCMSETATAFLAEVFGVLGIPFDPADPDAAISLLGSLAPVIGSTIRNTANPTRLAAGYKENVIPSHATASIDGRTVPGQHEEFVAQVQDVVGPGIEVEVVRPLLPPVETPFTGSLVEAMTAALRSEDPGARTLPYMISGATDAKWFASIGMRCFGFVPLLMPPGLDFTSLYHGIDERVPVDGLEFGVRALDHLFSNY